MNKQAINNKAQINLTWNYSDSGVINYTWAKSYSRSGIMTTSNAEPTVNRVCNNVSENRERHSVRENEGSTTIHARSPNVCMTK